LARCLFFCRGRFAMRPCRLSISSRFLLFICLCRRMEIAFAFGLSVRCTHTHTHTHTHTPHFFALSQLHKGLQGFCLCVKDTPTRILFFLLKRPIETSQTAFLGLCHLFPRFLVSMPADAHGIYHGHENAAIHFLNDGHNPCLDH